MTIKIIREGKVPEEQTYIAQCKHCKCLFEYQNSDVTDIKNAISDNYMLCERFYINCPTCRRNVTVNI